MLTNTIENLIHHCCAAAQLWQRPQRHRRAHPAIISAQPLEYRYLLSASSLSSFDFDDDDTQQDDHEDEDQHEDLHDDDRLFAASDDYAVNGLRDADDVNDDDGVDDDDGDDDDDDFFAAFNGPLLTVSPVSNHFGVLSDDSENSVSLTASSTALQSSDQELSVLPAATDTSEQSPAVSSDRAAGADVAESLEDSDAASNTARSDVVPPAATSAALVPAARSARAADAGPGNQLAVLAPEEALATDGHADTTDTFPLGMPDVSFRSPDVGVAVDPAGNTGSKVRQLLMVPQGLWPAASSVTHRANYAAMIREGSLTLEPAEGLVIIPRETAGLSGTVDTVVNASPASTRLSLAVSAVLLLTWLGAREQRRVEYRRISAG